MSGLSTETLRKIYADGDAESEWFFDTWLNKVKADAWDEGFDAGERDVWEHQYGEADENWDKDCIPNPYLERGNK